VSKLISRCGIDCGTCPWGPYPRKNMTAEEFERYRRNAKKILGYQPMKKPCFLCQTPDEEIPKEARLPSRNCLVRQCIDKISVENCAYCSRFPCDEVKDITEAWNRKKIEEKLGSPISEEDYHAFVEPFEALSRLEVIRASLKPEDIVEAANFPPLKIKVVDFPKNVPFSKEETEAFKTLHKFLAAIKRSSLGSRDIDTFAQQQRLKKWMPHFLRFLWILGRFGGFKKENGACLMVDAKTYMANRGSEKTLASWSFVKDTIFRILLDFGVQCERVSLKGVKEEDLTTGTGYLRSEGWTMTMSFEKKLGGVATLEALQAYANKLGKEYGKKTFRYFFDVDMQVLSED